MRRIIADRLNGGLLAALLVYALLFQSIGASIAGAHLAGMQVGTGSVCITSAPAHDHHGNTDPRHECCAVLCKAACTFGVSYVSCAAGPDLHPAPRDCAVAQPTEWDGLRSPRHSGLRREARAPPHLSAPEC
jgi:hypothetical protein